MSAGNGREPGFRFDPPAVDAGDAERWVLGRAFADRELELPEPQGVAAVALAEALALGPRIAARIAPRRLVGELGEEAAGLLKSLRARAVANEMRLEAALAGFDASAADLRVPYAPLKGQALALGGFSADGSRLSADVDILVPEERLEALQSELVRRGFAVAGERYEHQAPALRHPDGGTIELHRFVLGVRLDGRRSARFDELVAAGLVGAPPAGSTPTFRGSGERPRGDLRLPRRELLSAHAVVHALAQHGFAPRAYSGFNLVGDLLDLGFRGSTGSTTLAAIAPWIERAVPIAEAEAALELATALAEGDAAFLRNDRGGRKGAGGAAPGTARTLLDHFLAGALDARYAESLKVRALESPLSDRSLAGSRAAVIAGALLPARGRDSRRGRERWDRYLVRLAVRPFDLVRRWLLARAAGRR
jgi:hypothetical protein